MHPVSMSIQMNIPNGCFLFWAKPSGVSAWTAPLAAVNCELMFRMATIPGNHLEMLAPN
jgi:hypothetical protein